MSIDVVVFVVGAVFALGILIWTADYADRRQARWARWVVRLTVWAVALLYVFWGLGALLSAYADPPSADAPSLGAAWGGFVLSVLVAAAAVALTFAAVRRHLVRFFPRYRSEAAVPLPSDLAPPPLPALFPQEGEPLFSQQLNYYTDRTTAPEMFAASSATPNPPAPASAVRGFNPQSEVHALAMIVVVLALGGQFIDFVLGGGLSGVAEEFESGISIGDLLINSLPMVVLPFLGVGLGTRRTWREALRRLGLGRLTWEGVRVALAVTFGLLVWLVVVGVLWQTLVPQDVYEEQNQATDALASSVTTLGLAFTLAATAAVGEEITFRGALQPVFGFWATALCFTLFHAQYTLTPAWLMIFGVALALGWVRQRYNTTTAILTHFLYNFVQLLIALSIPAIF